MPLEDTPADALDLIRRLTALLDGAQGALNAAAAAEARREAGKPLRQITAQERAERARMLVAEATDFLNPPPAPAFEEGDA